jgi:hypothetical protein
MYRLQGDLRMSAGDQDAASQSYHRALTVAKLQGAKLLELSATQPRSFVEKPRQA